MRRPERVGSSAVLGGWLDLLTSGAAWLALLGAFEVLGCGAPRSNAPSVLSPAPVAAATRGRGTAPARGATPSSDAEALDCARNPQLDPLVTEWPASEKAHLQGVLSEQPVAVEYTGCELRILDECRLPGRYSWRRTEISQESLKIGTRDELASRLPLGGFNLEGELERSAGLVLRTTIAGQFDLNEGDLQTADIGPCARASHVIESVSVGAFSLASLSAAQGGTESSSPLMNETTQTTRAERVVREAGIPDSCAAATELAPDKQCSSPVRIELRSLEHRKPRTRLEQARKRGEVLVHIPLVSEDPGRWTLRTGDGSALCDLPCSRWLRPEESYSLERSLDGFGTGEVIPLEGAFPVAPGSHALGEYRLERGLPRWASWAFWIVGTPSLVFGGLLTFAGGLEALTGDGNDSASGLLVPGAVFSAVGGGLLVWYWWSEEASFRIKEFPGQQKPASMPTQAHLGVGPGYFEVAF